MKFFFETYGCQMNMAESAALAIEAKERGWEETKDPAEADLVLLNTCSVRATAEQRVTGRLAHYSALKKKAAKRFTLVMSGCMAERLGEKLKEEFPALDYLMGTSERSRFPAILEEAARNKSGVSTESGIFAESDVFAESGVLPATAETDEKPVFSFSKIHLDETGGNPFRSFVPIMHGCNNFCSYCIVPYVRGPEVSRSPASILEEIALLGEKGVREITLLGQNVNSYQWEGNSPADANSALCANSHLDFPGLLELVAGKIKKTSVRWIRFLSSHPKDFSPAAIKVIAENPAFCRHIHLCVQSGSNRILKAMNRRYTREEYLDLVYRLRAAMPDLSLSTDILVGFPGETDKDAEETLSLMEDVKFLHSYMYHYNPREGTAAFSLPERISEEVKLRRLSDVIALQKRHTAELLKSRVGREVTVLAEGVSRKNADEIICRTERDEMAVVPGDTRAVGSFGKLTLSSLKGNTFRAAAMELLCGV